MTEEQIQTLLDTTAANNELLAYICGFLLFFVVITLVKYVYRFLKMFF